MVERFTEQHHMSCRLNGNQWPERAPSSPSPSLMEIGTGRKESISKWPPDQMGG